jgi:hypothetical protein
MRTVLATMASSGAAPAPIGAALHEQSSIDGGHVKAFRSKRLDDVLKDPRAAEQLRAFLASASLTEPSSIEITVKDSNGNTIRYLPRLVRRGGSTA